MRIATWNVNGLRARAEQVAAWLDQEQPDVVCLQELKATREQIPPALLERTDYRSYWHGMKGYSGVGLLVRKDHWAEPLAFTHPGFDQESRIVVAEVGGVEIASIYVPNGGKDFAAKLRFLQAMVEHAAAARAQERALILCGDLNVAREVRDVHPDQRKLAIGQLPHERELIEAILAEGGLVDLGRAHAPDDDRLFTWWAPWRGMRQKNIGWRLDYVLASQDLAARMESCVVQKEVGTSDHAPVVATLR